MNAKIQPQWGRRAWLALALVSPVAACTAAPVASAAETSGPAKVDARQLKQTLAGLGFEPVDDETVDGRLVAFSIAWKQGSLSYRIRVVPDAAGAFIALQAPLSKLPASETQFGRELEALLTEAWSLLPSTLVIDRSDRRLYLTRVLPAGDLKADVVRSHLEALSEQTRRTYHLWRFDRSTASKDAAPEKPAAPSKDSGSSAKSPVEPPPPEVRPSQSHRTPSPFTSPAKPSPNGPSPFDIRS